MSSVTKDSLIERVANRCSVSPNCVRRVIDEIGNVATEALAAGNEVHIGGFGTFFTGKTSQRIGRIPNGQSVIIPAHTRVYFKPGKRLRTEVEGGVSK